MPSLPSRRRALQSLVAGSAAAGLSAIATPARAEQPIPDGKARKKLRDNQVYFVRADGEDTNAGLSDDQRDAFRNIQAAIDAAREVDTSGFDVFINVSGPQTKPVRLPAALVGGGSVIITGDVTQPDNCPITVADDHAFTASDGARMTVRGFKVGTTGQIGHGLHADHGAQIIHERNIFSSVVNSHIDTGLDGEIVAVGDYEIAGGGQSHWHTGMPSRISNIPIVITISGVPHFSAYFAGSAFGSIYFAGVTFKGAATGPKFFVHKNGVIDGAGAAIDALPGDSEGLRITGGEYVGPRVSPVFTAAVNYGGLQFVALQLMEEFRETGSVDVTRWDAQAEDGRHTIARMFRGMIDSGFDPRDPAKYVAWLKAEATLPGMPTKPEWYERHLLSGDLFDRLWFATELLALQFANLHDRIAALEAR
ncbi:hypothetical protein [Devosia sp. SL43]|uniref:hypothetical protein n=1 Tax=Devosia sp. SL43 TaxID=2806348 RepID=UPI001F3DDCC2|nr:hypothetical protein [Devosia sp. SL43]UJW87946.1 hypothetical protein IM737_20545 [Devosia sp. SL43]